ncbi:DUF551 domain-containing protein [[Clostridium] innocuum]|nr:DUF551 domain-containing protein [[Clostridium] innocuum]
MRDEINKEIVLHCLKSTSDFHGEICEECPIYSKCDHTWQSEVYEKTIEIIEGQWIPVEEKLPDTSKNYLVSLYFEYMKTECVSYAKYNPNGMWACCFPTIGEVDITNEVIAWMPLPPAHRRGGK